MPKGTLFIAKVHQDKKILIGEKLYQCSLVDPEQEELFPVSWRKLSVKRPKGEVKPAKKAVSNHEAEEEINFIPAADEIKETDPVPKISPLGQVDPILDLYGKLHHSGTIFGDLVSLLRKSHSTFKPYGNPEAVEEERSERQRPVGKSGKLSLEDCFLYAWPLRFWNS